MKVIALPKITFWKVVAAIFVVLGLYSVIVRFTQGLGSATNLSDEFPWGLWIGFDVVCGVGLAAGGFTLCAIVYIFNIKRFKPIIRPTVLTAFLGYVLVIVALLIDLGRPDRIWHAIVMWNPHSVMFEVAWCVMLYTTVLALEFSPIVFEKFKWQLPLKIVRAITIPLVIVGVLLSTLHQSSLGSLYLMVPDKLYALWYSPTLPIFFFISAMGVGCAMVILESFLSHRAFRKSLEMDLLTDLGRVIVVLLLVYVVLKAYDLSDRGVLNLLIVPQTETYLYWAEMGFGVLLPIVLLSISKVRTHQRGLFISAVLVVLGFIMNRMNVSITGIQATAKTTYFPSWMEIMVTVFVVTVGFIVFSYVTKYFSVFTPDENQPAVTSDEQYEVKPRKAESLASA
jgi:Ni/Fe-hydrogenase subunit HybB-like protein